MGGASGYLNSGPQIERRKGNYGPSLPVATQLEEINPPFAGTMNFNDITYNSGYLLATFQNTYQVSPNIGSLSWSSTFTASGVAASSTKATRKEWPGFIIAGEAGTGQSRIYGCNIDGTGGGLIYSGAINNARPFPVLADNGIFWASGHAGSVTNKLWQRTEAGVVWQFMGVAMGDGQPESILKLAGGSSPSGLSAGKRYIVVGQGGTLATNFCDWEPSYTAPLLYSGVLRSFGGATGTWYTICTNGRIICVGGHGGGTARALASGDGGVTWTNTSLGFAAIMCRIVLFRCVFVAVILVNAAPQRTVIRYSYDGINWTTAHDVASIFMHTAVATPDGVVMWGNNGVTNNRAFRFKFLRGV